MTRLTTMARSGCWPVRTRADLWSTSFRIPTATPAIHISPLTSTGWRTQWQSLRGQAVHFLRSQPRSTEELDRKASSIGPLEGGDASPGAAVKLGPVGEAIGAIRAMHPSPIAWDKQHVQPEQDISFSVSLR